MITSPDDPHHPMIHPTITTTKTHLLQNFTNMDPISNAMAAINAQEPGDELTYRAAAQQFGVKQRHVVPQAPGPYTQQCRGS
jgi:hypothetical protein